LSKKCEEQKRIAEEREQSQVCNGAVDWLSHSVHECIGRTSERECHEAIG